MSNSFSRILFIAKRECRRLIANPVYVLGMVVFPILVTVLFTSLMDEGQPEEMPVGVVDLDNTSFTRKLTRSLDAFQTTHIVARYPNVEEARKAMQQGTIYAFLYYPKGTTDALLSSRQPTISFYYSYTSLTAGSLLFRDLKTISTLGSAAVGSATLKAKGLTDAQIEKLPDNIIGIKRTQNQRELACLYSMADILLSLSNAETFGMTMAEAYACGTPCIVYDNTAQPEIVTPQTGRIAKTGDIDELVRLIYEMTESKFKQNHSTDCRKHAEEHFNKDKCFEKYIELYNRILEDK